MINDPSIGDVIWVVSANAAVLNNTTAAAVSSKKRKIFLMAAVFSKLISFLGATRKTLYTLSALSFHRYYRD
jgi:hypothetical protein